MDKKLNSEGKTKSYIPDKPQKKRIVLVTGNVYLHLNMIRRTKCSSSSRYWAIRTKLMHKMWIVVNDILRCST